MEILAANGLVKSYSRRRVVDGVSLEVRAGEIVGLLGPMELVNRRPLK